MGSILFLASLLSLISVSFALADTRFALNRTLTTSTRQKGEQCRSQCRFKVCRGRKTTLLGAPGKATQPTICRRGQDIENILSTGEAMIIESGTSTPISEWSPAGLEAPFKPNYLSTKPIPGRFGLSGVVRLPAKKNQNKFLDGVCAVIPVEKYERVVRGKLREVTTRSLKDCLSVQLIAPTVVIEAFWFSGDDLDLEVIEPDGVRVDNRMRKSSCGQLNRDNNVDACGVFDSGTERIVYNLPCDGFKAGKYKAVLRHASNCGVGPSAYEVRVVVDGRLKKMVNGESNANGGEKIASFSFNLA